MTEQQINLLFRALWAILKLLHYFIIRWYGKSAGTELEETRVTMDALASYRKWTTSGPDEENDPNKRS